jgi:hypothetical protein
VVINIMFLPKPSFLPDPRLLAEFIQRKRHTRIARKEEQGMVHQWFLLGGQVSKEWLLDPHPAALRKLMPPNDRTWADPFLWKRGEDWFIFCEEWIFGNPHGHIAVMQLARDGRELSPSKPVLVQEHHLSYPFLFEHQGSLYMMPEAGAGRALKVYECEEFPFHWRQKATLMRDIEYADATMLEHQGRWWLLVTIKRGVFALNRDLFAFWAGSPLAEQWTPHPANPVVRGLKRARPGGRMFELGGKLYRPSQNCLVRYGHSLNINEILRLDPKRYEERLVTEVRPDWEKGIRANHHIDWREGMLVMDAQRLLPVKEIAR